MDKFYVYVYIDPRNYEEFYYGKGKGSRKNVHLFSEDVSEKNKRIKEIQKLGMQPIIRVIAANLTEQEAFMVETTLIWKLGKFTTNLASGYFSGKFRPHNTLHCELPTFDYKNNLYYYNVGENVHRNWEDYIKYGFISAGQGIRWRDAMLGFNEGDVVIAYLKGYGFIGIGKILQKAKMIKDIFINNKLLLDCKLKCINMNDNCNNQKKSEYVALVKWIKALNREDAKWKSNAGLYTTTHIRATIENQPKTIKFIEKEFNINLKKLII